MELNDIKMKIVESSGNIKLIRIASHMVIKAAWKTETKELGYIW